MRRRLLITLTAVGSVIVALAGLGVFAALTDTATSGDNSVETVAQPLSADIVVSELELPGSEECAAGTDDLTSGLFTVEAADFGETTVAYFCIRNVGLNRVNYTVGVQDLTDIEVACTGEEAEVDQTCGPGPFGDPQAGELADGVWLSYWYDFTCQFWEEFPTTQQATLTQAATTPTVIGESLLPGSHACYAVQIYLDPNNLHRLRAQSDRVTWRFRWDATAVYP